MLDYNNCITRSEEVASEAFSIFDPLVLAKAAVVVGAVGLFIVGNNAYNKACSDDKAKDDLLSREASALCIEKTLRFQRKMQEGSFTLGNDTLSFDDVVEYVSKRQKPRNNKSCEAAEDFWRKCEEFETVLMLIGTRGMVINNIWRTGLDQPEWLSPVIVQYTFVHARAEIFVKHKLGNNPIAVEDQISLKDWTVGLRAMSELLFMSLRATEEGTAVEECEISRIVGKFKTPFWSVIKLPDHGIIINRMDSIKREALASFDVTSAMARGWVSIRQHILNSKCDTKTMSEMLQRASQAEADMLVGEKEYANMSAMRAPDIKTLFEVVERVASGNKDDVREALKNINGAIPVAENMLAAAGIVI